jgi:hypothetical protein
VSKKNRISGWKDAAKHYSPSSIMRPATVFAAPMAGFSLPGALVWLSPFVASKGRQDPNHDPSKVHFSTVLGMFWP